MDYLDVLKNTVTTTRKVKTRREFDESSEQILLENNVWNDTEEIQEQIKTKKGNLTP